MTSLQIIVILTALIEAGLTLALVFRAANPEPKHSHPHFKARSTKFPRSRRNDQGTWIID